MTNASARELSFFTMRERADAVRAEAAEKIEPVGTGYSLDGQYGGIGPGQLGLLLARTKVGKTTMLSNIVANTPQTPTVLFSLEMPLIDLDEWLVGISNRGHLNTPVGNMRHVMQDESHPEYEELNEAFDRKAETFPNLTMVPAINVPSVLEIQMTVDDIEAATGVRPVRVIIDHLSLVQGGRSYESMTELTALLHTWAVRENLLVMATQQTTKGGGIEGRNNGHIRPGLGDGLYAGEADADWIWGIWQPIKDPDCWKKQDDFKSMKAFETAMLKKERYKNKTLFTVVTCRRDSTLNDEEVELTFDHHSYELRESK